MINEPDESNEQIIWKHPVQLIMSADAFKIEPRKSIVCHHLPIRHPGWMNPRDLKASAVRTEEFHIPLQPYLFDFEDTLGWSLIIYMNICSCGTLYLFDKAYRRTIIRKHVFGFGSHEYVEREELL